MSRDGLTRDGRYRLTLRSRIKYGPTATRISNWRNRKAWERGKRDVPARVGDQVRSRTPVVRDRINRATGRPHRDDRSMGQASDRTLSRLAEQQKRLRAAEKRNREARPAVEPAWKREQRSLENARPLPNVRPPAWRRFR